MPRPEDYEYDKINNNTLIIQTNYISFTRKFSNLILYVCEPSRARKCKCVYARVSALRITLAFLSFENNVEIYDKDISSPPLLRAERVRKRWRRELITQRLI